MKYKVGDKVRVSEKLRSTYQMSGVHILDCMREAVGRAVTISRADADTAGDRYRVEELDCWWGEDMFEQIKTNYEVGDKVVYTDSKHHSERPEFYPKAGTYGRIVDNIFGDIYTIQWDKGSTSENDIWACSCDRFKPAESAPKPKKEKKPFDWKAFKDGSVGVLCKTEEDARNFLKKCYDNGITKWHSGDNLLSFTSWNEYKEKTVYVYSDGSVGFGRVEYAAKTLGKKIIKYPFKTKLDTTFDWKAFKDGKVAVRCLFDESKRDFLRDCEKALPGLRWHSSAKLGDFFPSGDILQCKGGTLGQGKYGNVSVVDYPFTAKLEATIKPKETTKSEEEF
ncbi:MAG TPA: hypothetical protein PLG47_04810, partial [Candidatus Dojkabacteria bacterium]|nr:hypothetical protein [Candidatus Dojkabacteria bacterium]